ncbi:MAG: OmpP1/FadL family transporter [Myxococcota bacterium]
MFSLVLMVLPSVASAGGFYAGDGGVRATGRAGAFVAGANDLSAMSYNPAALSRVGNQLTFGLAGVHQAVWFQRDDEPFNDLTFDPVRNQAPPLPIPSIAGSLDFGVEDLTVAFGVYTPYSPSWSYDPNGAQRFASTETLVLAGNVGPSVSYRFADRLSVGAGVAWTFMSVDQTLVAHVAPLSFPAEDDPAYDVTTRVQVFDWARVTGNVGLMYETVDKRVAVGASYVPQIRYRPRGSLTADFSKNTYYTGESGFGQVIAEPSAADDDVVLNIVLPHTVRLGVLVRPAPHWELELDLVWENWASMPPLEVTDLQLTIPTTLAEDAVVNEAVALPLKMQDAYSVRLGAEGAISDRTRLRGGLAFESSSLAPDQRSVLLPDGHKLTWALGASVEAVPKTLTLDFAYSQSLIFPASTSPSGVFQVQIDPQTGAVGTGKAVGNGQLGALTSIVGLGLNWTPRTKRMRTPDSPVEEEA